MNLRQKRKEDKRKKTYTQHFSDCDKESKIKGCQQSERPRSERWFYMKFMKNQSEPLPIYPCPMLWKFVQTCSSPSIKSHHLTPLCCARLNSFHVVMFDCFLYYENSFFLDFINSPRVINFDSAARYLFICFMSNVNLSRPVIIPSVIINISREIM